MKKIIKFIKKLWRGWNRAWDRLEKQEEKYREECLKRKVPYSPVNPFK